MKFLIEQKRSHYCGELRAKHEGTSVTLMGWVNTRRDHGGLIFIDLRDRSGLSQIVLDPKKLKEAKIVRREFVIAVYGEVTLRPDGMLNKNLSTGGIEVHVNELKIFSGASELPIQIGDAKVSESMRLKYRYLDIRSSRLQKNLLLRHKLSQATREFLSEQGFLEVETPVLYKSTPEGARDYLVPSRVNSGQFYALPQSPQTLKQLLMVGGLDRYFQIAKCFRDEDLRADRQPEFTQIDLEMSFVNEDDVMTLTEKLIRRVWQKVKNQELDLFSKISYEDAMNRFGCDKPDLRIAWELKDVAEVVSGQGFKVFDSVAKKNGSIKALAVPQIFSRGQLDKLTDLAKENGAKGLVWIAQDSKGFSSPVKKFFSDSIFEKVFESCGGLKEGTVFIVADDFKNTCSALSALRLELAERLEAVNKSQDQFLWVTEFPLFDYSTTERKWLASHHPFTQPQEDHLESFLSQKGELGDIKARAYDLVCNGCELGSGSVRIHDQAVQKAMFDALEMSVEEREKQFGFFIEALTYGTPPHAGIALGLDRIAMILCETNSIRDVVAFPKTARGGDLMSEAPNFVETAQLLELGIQLLKPPTKV